jgi:hypothetical protein
MNTCILDAVPAAFTLLANRFFCKPFSQKCPETFFSFGFTDYIPEPYFIRLAQEIFIGSRFGCQLE